MAKERERRSSEVGEYLRAECTFRVSSDPPGHDLPYLEVRIGPRRLDPEGVRARNGNSTLPEGGVDVAGRETERALALLSAMYPLPFVA